MSGTDQTVVTVPQDELQLVLDLATSALNAREDWLRLKQELNGVVITKELLQTLREKTDQHSDVVNHLRQMCGMPLHKRM